jgi:hypothetical protein
MVQSMVLNVVKCICCSIKLWTSSHSLVIQLLLSSGPCYTEAPGYSFFFCF